MDKKLSLIDKFRAWPWLLAAVVMTVVVGWLHPYQLGVLLWSLSKLALGAFLGYWIDRSIFYYARPGEYLEKVNWYSTQDAGEKPILSEYQLKARGRSLEMIACMLRRAVIIGATILALGLGV